MSAPVFVLYYLWWNYDPKTSPSSNWRHLGPNYPYTANPSPLPARIGVSPNFDSPTSDESVVTSLYAGNTLQDVSDQFWYNQRNPDVIELDCCTAYNYGAEGFAVNWADPSRKDDTENLDRVVKQADKITTGNDKEKFQIIFDYKGETNPSSPRPADAVIWDWSYFYNTYKDSVALYKINNKPVVIWTGSWGYPEATIKTVTDTFKDKFHILGGQPWSAWPTHSRGYNVAQYFSGDVHYWPGQDPYSNPQVFSQMKGLSDKLKAEGKTFGCPISPGFDRRIQNAGSTFYCPRKNGETLQRLFDGHKAASPDFYYLISWNEISENSHIVPLRRYGNRYIDVLKALTAA